MPFYEYECSACKFYVEALQKISDPQIKKCPSCKKQTMKRLISAPVFRLKGSGWYETDFKSDQDNKRNLAASDDKDSVEKKDESKLESKPDVKEDAKPAETKSAEGESKSEKSGHKAAVSAGAKKSTKARPKPKPAVEKK